ncbi:polysaccharide deacetylase [Syntrophobotulus glycolicus DSM 8271]|uniref:Polysaccharide deacetylase n=2 Tax=Syntrophobotulus TaxID=51196 RepID=F0T052_SYNGF|nr:polysaccharide deacetylase [Syntrophobotulus glycolicus DSM 8271]
MNNFLFLFLYFFIPILFFYLIIPEICLHILGWGSWKRQYTSGVALTFDDGPDPNFTPLILDSLAKLGVKATFFLVAEKAENHPALVRRIVQEGHTIGCHCYAHRHAWTMGPMTTIRYWKKGLASIKQLSGHEPEYIRPPWGGVNLAFYLWCKLRGKQIVHWSIQGHDWLHTQTPEKILHEILPKIKAGSIILLHDSGGDFGAPQNTVELLPKLVSEIYQNLKLPLVELEIPNWSLYRRIFFRLWEQWERFYVWYFHIQRIDPCNLFRLSLARYKGPNLYDHKGNLLAAKGDLIGEIHLDSLQLQFHEQDYRKIGVKTLQLARKSFPVLTKFIFNSPDYKDIKVYLGVTMLSKAVKGFGFHVQDYHSIFSRMTALFQKIIIKIYHPGGGRETSSLGDKPKLVWITRDTLAEKYL